MPPQKHFSLAEAKQIGDALGIDWHAFGIEQFQMGLEVELEHGTREPQTNVTDDNPMITGKSPGRISKSFRITTLAYW